MALPDKFSLVTVMDVEVFEEGTSIGTIDSLTMTNITQEGPRKEARGGLHAEPIVRYGKTMNVEMEDVIARRQLFEALFGTNTNVDGEISFTEKFATSLKLVGSTKVVGSDGETVDATVTIYDFLPDSITDFTMESEGDVGVVNISGELFPSQETETAGLFYTIE